MPETIQGASARELEAMRDDAKALVRHLGYFEVGMASAMFDGDRALLKTITEYARDIEKKLNLALSARESCPTCGPDGAPGVVDHPRFGAAPCGSCASAPRGD